MAFDPTKIDTSSTLGQITVLIAVIVFLIMNLRQLLPGVKDAVKHRNVKTVTEERDRALQELRHCQAVIRNLGDHQIASKEALRAMRLAMANEGVPLDERTEALLTTLTEIEQRSQEGFVDES